MGTIRGYLAAHRALAAWLIAMALVMKVLIPVGFMPVLSGGSITVELCSGHGVETMAMPGMAHDHQKQDGSAKDGSSCGFGGHSPAAMASTDPILLTIAVALIVAGVFRRPILPSIERPRFLRPHLRGPPAIA